MKRKPDYWLKSVVLNEHFGLVDFERKRRRASYLEAYEMYDKLTPELLWCLEFNNFCQVKWSNELYYDEAVRIVNADRQRTKRLRNRITQYLCSGNCLFLTLTFDDDCLNNTSEDTRRQYVRKWLKSVSNHFVANIDYGKKNGREHYHAVVLVDKVDYSTWTHGAINGQKVKSTYDDVALAKYICKLTNHAIKNTTQRKALIYSSSKCTT